MQQPIPGDQVRPDALRKGDLIFIQHYGKEESELGIFIGKFTDRVLFHSFSEPTNRIYDYYFGDGRMPTFFRVNPPDYTSKQIDAFRESDVFKYLGHYVRNLRFMRERIGAQLYFEESSVGDLHTFVPGILKSFSITPVGSYTLTYQDMSRRVRTKRGDYDDKPTIYEYTGSQPRRPHPYTANQLLGRVGAVILEKRGPEEGIEILKYHLGKAGMNRRIHLLKANKNTRNAAKKAWTEAQAKKAAAEAAAGGGGGGSAENNNTTKGGSRQKRRRKTRRHRK